MKIEIIGCNTINGIKLRKRVVEIVNNIDGKVIISLVEDFTHQDLPFLYINDQLVSKGTVPNNKEIVKYIKKIYKE